MQLCSLFFVLAACAVPVCFAATETQEWNYILSDLAKGPNVWSTNFPTCGGTRNSPINLLSAGPGFVRTRAVPWVLNNWNGDNSWKVKDEHYTVKFSLESGQAMSTSGGGLGTVYDIVQFHFHWGADNTIGSEHLLNGRSFPMEIHFVHKNSRYATIGDAVASGASDALAAVGFFFQIQAQDNPQLNAIINAVQVVRQDSDFEVSGVKVRVMDFVTSAFKSSYYRYFGGLTTPGCQEIVLWTVFTEPIGISARQMQILRTQANMSFGVNFFRAVQPLGSRLVQLFETQPARRNRRPRRRRGRRGRRGRAGCRPRNSRRCRNLRG